MSGFKPEYLEGIYNKIDDLEKTQRLIAMLSVLDISMSWGDNDDARTVLKIFDSIFYDRGEYDVDDLKRAVETMKMNIPKEVSAASQRLMSTLLDQLIPRK